MQTNFIYKENAEYEGTHPYNSINPWKENHKTNQTHKYFNPCIIICFTWPTIIRMILIMIQEWRNPLSYVFLYVRLFSITHGHPKLSPK